MQYQSTKAARKYAPELRSNQTDAEQYLWQKLRGEQLAVKFRRQHPLGNYITDFACLDPKLIVEIDGSQHLAQGQYDDRREQFFAQHGFMILRFWSNEVLENTEGVLMRILEAITAAPTLTLPQRGRGLTSGVLDDRSDALVAPQTK